MKHAFDGGAESIRTVSVQALEKVIGRSDSVALDVREADEFAYEHIAGTLNIPQSRMKVEMSRFPKDKELYVFCNTGIRSAQAVELFKSGGFQKIRLVEGGIAAWKSAGFPLKRSKGPIPIMRQVQIVAGALALIGGLFVQLRWIAIFVGAGLLFAGASGFCTMAKLLAYLPWNKSLRGGNKPDSSCGPGRA